MISRVIFPYYYVILTFFSAIKVFHGKNINMERLFGGRRGFKR